MALSSSSSNHGVNGDGDGINSFNDLSLLTLSDLEYLASRFDAKILRQYIIDSANPNAFGGKEIMMMMKSRRPSCQNDEGDGEGRYDDCQDTSVVLSKTHLCLSRRHFIMCRLAVTFFSFAHWIIIIVSGFIVKSAFDDQRRKNDEDDYQWGQVGFPFWLVLKIYFIFSLFVCKQSSHNYQNFFS
jgi:hypothetical protein